MRMIPNVVPRACLKGFCERHATALKAIPAKLPQNLKGDLKRLYDKLNEPLSNLPVPDQVQAGPFIQP